MTSVIVSVGSRVVKFQFLIIIVNKVFFLEKEKTSKHHHQSTTSGQHHRRKVEIDALLPSLRFAYVVKLQ